MKAPVQDRARISLARMLQAAESVLVEQGAEAVTLAGVSRAGGVSIGSIYHRFKDKDELLRAVHAGQMARLRQEHAALIEEATAQAAALPALLQALVGGMANLLDRNAAVLLALMSCAAADPVISQEGQQTWRHLRDLFVQAVMRFGDSIGQPGRERAAGTCFEVAYAVFARELGFDAAHSGRGGREIGALKEDIAAMCTAFLMSGPAGAVAGPARPGSDRAGGSGGAAG